MWRSRPARLAAVIIAVALMPFPLILHGWGNHKQGLDGGASERNDAAGTCSGRILDGRRWSRWNPGVQWLAVEGALEGISINFSSGDDGDEASTIGQPEADFPATDPWVTAVGGTNLTHAANARGWKEKAWFTSSDEAAGSGCSVSVAKPAWQHDPDCTYRTDADIAAQAGVSPGV